MDRRQFEIKLGLLIMAAFSEGLGTDDLIDALEARLEEEHQLRRQRRKAAKSY